MTDAPTPPMTPEQRAEFVAWLRRVRMRPTVADQLEADGVTIATLTAERDAAQAEIARLTAALATPDQIAALASVRAADQAEIELLLKNHNGMSADLARMIKQAEGVE